MEKEEFEKWVDYVVENGLKPPRSIVANYDYWKSRLMLARFLSRHHKQFKAAIELFESVVNVDLTKPEDIEDKAWAMRDLGVCIWNEYKDANKALEYLNMAISLIESGGEPLSFIERGEIWRDRWEILNKIDKTEQALVEADEKISIFKEHPQKTNSYLYHAYSFKAEQENAKGNYAVAVFLIKQALTYFPLEDNEQAELLRIWEQRQGNLKQTYDTMKKMTHNNTALVWDL